VKVNVHHKDYYGMLYIGNRPTVNGLSKVIEVNIFDFNQDIYDENIKVEFHKYIRGDKKLKGLDELKSALAEDEVASRTFFR